MNTSTSVEKLFVGVLGNVGAGKSYTWRQLLRAGDPPSDGWVAVPLGEDEYVDVFLIDRYSGCHEQLGTILNLPIVFCSLLYEPFVKEYLQRFIDFDYRLYIQWLNPGCSSQNRSPRLDTLDVVGQLKYGKSTVGIRSGAVAAEARVEELRDFVRKWARAHNLTYRRLAPHPDGVVAARSIITR
ncbi:MAG: hypothetical protein WBA12_14760 [Catalinimonas sp.]